MALTESNMIALGSSAPKFSLPNVVTNQVLQLSDIVGSNATMIVFMCNHCPYVVHVLDGIIEYSNDYRNKGLNVIAISSNNVNTHPMDGPDKMKELSLQKKFEFPYLYDETQDVAKNYEAACTPDFYLFNKHLSLEYRGCFDQSRPGNNEPVTGKNLREASDNLLSGKPISSDQIPSMGCNIKWK